MTSRFRSSWIVTSALFASLAVAAQHEGHEGHPAMEAEGHQEMGEAQHEMSPEEAAMMQAWQAAATPGPAHARLAKAAGHFKMTVKTWMGDPSAPPEASEGTSHREMVMGGRYLIDHVEGTMMGGPFRGMGVTGYDNVKSKYWGTWMDSMGTGVMLSEGDVDAEGKLVMVGTYADAVTRGTKTAKMVVWWEGDDKEIFEMFEPRGDDWVRVMEITYLRQ